MARGRPRTPTEIKRRRGTSRPDRDPPAALVAALPMAKGIPDFPEGLHEEGQDLWRRIWTAGLTWISPHSDIFAVESICRLADDLAMSRERYHATRDPADGRMVATFTKELHSTLAAFGFTPAARSQLKVAEVKAQTGLEKLLADRDA